MTNRLSITDIRARKNATPIVTLTAYTAPLARILDPHVDILLVGDSLGMVVYGMDGTRHVTLEMMIAHGRAVVNASSRALVVVDMPFGSVEHGKVDALANCRRVMQETGCSAIKIEGGEEMAPTIAYLVQQGIPVMGHVGLLPQRVTTPDGFKYQGRTEEDAQRILEDAQAIERAGAFAMVIEAVSEPVARNITAKVGVPTIGIGASPACDGQVLVIDDLLGLTERAPKFVKRYAALAPVIEEAVKTYSAEVKSRTFPGPEHCFGKKD